MPVVIDTTGRKPITEDELRTIRPVCDARPFPLAEGIKAVEWGWPGVLVQRAIVNSEAQDAVGIDYWLDSRGWVSWWRRREDPT